MFNLFNNTKLTTMTAERDYWREQAQQHERTANILGGQNIKLAETVMELRAEAEAREAKNRRVRGAGGRFVKGAV